VNNHKEGDDSNLHVIMEMVAPIIWKNDNNLGAISASTRSKMSQQASTTMHFCKT